MSQDSLLSPYGDTPQAQGESCDAPSKTCSTCRTTRIVRGTIAFLVIGTAGVYGAVTAKPELAEYLPFLPGMKGDQCPIAAMFGGSSSCSATAGSCPAASGPATSACSTASRAAMLEACSRLNAPESDDAATEVVLADSVFDAGAAPPVPPTKPD